MANLKKIIKNIDVTLGILGLLKKSLGDKIIENSTMDAVEISKTINVLEVLRIDWEHILDDLCRLS